MSYENASLILYIYYYGKISHKLREVFRNSSLTQKATAFYLTLEYQ
jgi:hypothetical protein